MKMLRVWACGGALVAGASAPAQTPCEVLVWADEFDGTALDTERWDIQTGTGTAYGLTAWGNNELQTYTADNLAVGDGLLRITALEQASGNSDYTSGRIRTAGLAAFAGGRIEARIRVPAGQGLWPAFWMLPEEARYGGWAVSGELDIMEVLGHDPGRLHCTVHYGGQYPCNSNTGESVTGPDLSADFHTYGVQWGDGTITWLLDGVAVHTLDESGLGGRFWPFDRPFHLLLNLAVGGNWPGSPDASTPFPAELAVDWVRVWQSAEGSWVRGRSAVQAGALEETYAVPALPEASYAWTVTGGELISGDGSSEVAVVWSGSDAAGEVRCTLTAAGCTAELSREIAIAQPEGECVFPLADFENDGGDRAAWSCGYGAIQVLPNGNSSPANPSARCLQFVGTPEGDDRVSFVTDAVSDAGALSSGTYAVAVDVFANAPAGTEVRVAAGRQGVTAPACTFRAYTAAAYSWHTLYFTEPLGLPSSLNPSSINELTLRPAPGSPWTSTFLFDNLRLVDAACVPVGVAESATTADLAVRVVGEGVLEITGVTGRLRVYDALGRMLAEAVGRPDGVQVSGLGSGLRVVVSETGATRSVWMP
jgi:beta-glucanase (GH16 family)